MSLEQYPKKTLVRQNRSETLQKVTQEPFDLLVIGGGATGCGIALDAASRGLKPVLIEKNDFASGTSSKSTKLIHGGLRYLKQLEIGLVHETGTERAIVHHLAPHLVLPEKMLLPFIEDGTFGKFTTSLALKVYDILAGVAREDQRKMLSKEESLELEPLLNEKVLKGGGFYAEYRTDDARLTIELIKTALRYGALALNYVQADDFIYNEDGTVMGAQCTNHLTGESIEIKASKIVSAAGPWVDILRKEDKSLKGKRLHLTKGVHIVVDQEKFPLKQAVYFDVPDGRMIFAIPRGRATYVGTTDTTYKGDLDRVVATNADAKYLLNAVNNAFPKVNLQMEDIESNWSGLRPLIHEDGKSPSELSRKDEIFESDTGLISIAGGKLTGYRKMGERIVNLVAKSFPSEKRDNWKNCFSKEIALTPASLKDSKAVESYIKEISDKVSKIGLKPYHGWYLVTNYGKQCEEIIEEIDQSIKDPLEALVLSELAFGLEYEMVESVTDFFVRRTGRLFFDIHSLASTKDIVLEKMKQELNWDANRYQTEKEKLELMVQDATHFYESEAMIPA